MKLSLLLLTTSRREGVSSYWTPRGALRWINKAILSRARSTCSFSKRSPWNPCTAMASPSASSRSAMAFLNPMPARSFSPFSALNATDSSMANGRQPRVTAARSITRSLKKGERDSTTKHEDGAAKRRPSPESSRHRRGVIMSLLRNLGSGLRSLFRKKQVNRELDEELRSYFEMAAEEKIRRGMSAREARRAVRLEHGHVDTTKERVRSAGWESLVDMLWQDLRYSLRGLRKNPGFTAIAVLTLALGIAANTTVLSWVSATLLNPIPGVAHTSDLVTIDRGDCSDFPTPPFSYPDLRDLSERTQTFSGLLGYHEDYMSLTGVAKPERIYGALTTANYFEVLGVQPILGRTFLPEEGTPHAGAAVIVIGHAVWQNHFAGDPQIVGKKIQINRHPYTVVGVAPRDFTGCAPGLRAELWIPLSMDRDVWGADRPGYRGTFWLNVLGKLRPGVTKNQAQAELNLLMRGIVERFPEDHRDSPNEISLDPLWRSPFGINGYLYKILPMLLGLAGVLLLLACANVASLLLVRSVGRRREIAIRLGMGASRKQIIRQFLIESLLLGLLGGTAAIVITVWTSRSLVAFFPPSSLPLTNDARVDQRVLFVTIAVSILAAIISGVLPALRSSSLPVQSVLKEEATSVSLTLHKGRL